MNIVKVTALRLFPQGENLHEWKWVCRRAKNIVNNKERNIVSWFHLHVIFVKDRILRCRPIKSAYADSGQHVGGSLAECKARSCTATKTSFWWNKRGWKGTNSGGVISNNKFTFTKGFCIIEYYNCRYKVKKFHMRNLLSSSEASSNLFCEN